MRHYSCLLLLALVFGAATSGRALAAEVRKPPNIVIILADDLGHGDPGCYSPESKIPTPHIDRLALQGMRFTDAHTPSSVCSPTRYGLLTGRYCWRTPLKRWVLWPWDGPLIEPDRLTLPGMLKKHGYATACIGKWHLGWEWSTKDGTRMNDTITLGKSNSGRRRAFAANIDFAKTIKGGPRDHGFDYYFGDDVPNFPPYCFIENDRTLGIPSQQKPESMFGDSGPMLPGWDLAAVMPKLTQKAVEYIDGRATEPRRKPFFLYMPLTAPHTPIAPTEQFLGKSKAGRYGDFVHQVDWTVGQVLAALDRNGLAGDTLVIFTSDNGSPARDGTNMSGRTGSVVKKFGHNPSHPWRGMKADIWEGGHRVPFSARWPGHVGPKTKSSEIICLTDVMATVATIVGHDLPESSAEDSFNFLPVLRGQKPRQPIRETIVHHSVDGTFAIREGNWKLIDGNLGSGGFTRPRRKKPGPDDPQGQLYNLTDDPKEQNNVWSQHPAVVKRLTERLNQIKRSGRSRGRIQ